MGRILSEKRERGSIIIFPVLRLLGRILSGEVGKKIKIVREKNENMLSWTGP